MRKKLIYVLVPVLLVLVWLGFSGEGDEAYLEQVQEIIDERVKYLRTSESSPFRQYDEPFREPNFFPIDVSYRINATVERIQKRNIVTLPNSQSGVETYEEFAWLNFTVNGERQKLLVLRPSGFGALKVLFLAFTDETSADETYGGGRYLDVEIGKSDKVVLDFNLSYNPYCAYTDKYSCTLPPKENHLSVSIKAGEKNFK